MSNPLLTRDEFLFGVRDHKLTVLHESGVYRHLRFERPGPGCMHFDLITYPGHLVYSGDMGYYVFERHHDMLEFFRSDNGRINPHYWAEKLRAVDGNRHSAAAMEFDPEAFKSAVKSDLVSMWRDADLTAEDRRSMRAKVASDVLDKADEGEDVAVRAAIDFTFTVRKPERRDYSFRDFWDNNVRRYTRTFLWCCYAIAWGVQQFDAAEVPA